MPGNYGICGAGRASQQISWDGWADDTSGLALYQYHVYELYNVGGQLLHKTLATSGTVNDGSTSFTTAYGVDSAGGSTLSVPADFSFSVEPDLGGLKTMQAGVKDGQSLTFWVRAYDIRDDYLEESVTVHVDSSPPVITNLWLTKDHIENISVHGLEQLNEMTIEWVAYDDHSGLETVQWRLLDLHSGSEIVHGVENVPAQGETQTLDNCQTTYGGYARGPNCYCTGAAGCYHRHFQVKPTIIDSNVQDHGGIFNHARSPEVDYQSSTSLHAHWSDFFDRESGIKFYQYAFHTACLTASSFGHVTDDSRVNVTYGTTASWEAPGPGTYYVTVVAYNSAIEPSDPVCSDGVTVDVTAPAVSGVYVEGAYIVAGLVRQLYLNWTGSDTQSGIYDYEVGMATAADNSVSPDISGYTSTNHHSFYSVYHPALTEDSPFYILIRATNKAGVSSVTTLGPVILTRRPPTYAGSVELTLSANHLMVTWDNSQFTDVEPQHLTFSVALERIQVDSFKKLKMLSGGTSRIDILKESA
nr:hypothetical protein BaRGS_018042 [Batillaria attramentaria]